MKEKIKNLLGLLNQGLVERDAALKASLLSVLAGENVVLIGPPGTGKSLIARRIAESLSSSDDYFEYLLTKFSTPEEIFGPLSITELKADRFKRNTSGYLPSVKVAFLDEIFKASSSILNSLLTILNERIYHNGAEPIRVPLQALISASNELPTDQEELSALYDRFLVRTFVDYINVDKLPLLFENTQEPKFSDESKLTAADLDIIRQSAETIIIPSNIMQAILRIWAEHKEAFKEDRREQLSDRRLKKVLKLLRISAATNGRIEVDLSDVLLLKNCLWNHQDNAEQVSDIIKMVLLSFSEPVALSNDGHIGETVSEPAETKAASKQTAAKLSSKVKGFKGSGTESDPLLVETSEHLADLEREEVGSQGYYFQQTCDLDCSEISTWPKISFIGYYNGGGKIISFNENISIFKNLSSSTFNHLELKNCSLAVTVENNSSISNCHSDVDLVTSVDGGTLTACQAGKSLIVNNASNCIITACQSGASLIAADAANCTISGSHSGSCLVLGCATRCNILYCSVSIDLNIGVKGSGLGGWETPEQLGGIAFSLNDGCLVEHCFITGQCNGTRGLFERPNFSGVTISSRGSTIRQCALGLFQVTDNVNFTHIAFDYDPGSLESNISIDSNAKDISDGHSVTTIAATRFNQRYFENTLHWDFDGVWKWDDQGNRPVLRSVGLGAIVQDSLGESESIENMTDLLTLQLKANIWL